MWGDSWINLRMKMADMPYYDYNNELEDEPGAKEGTIDDLKRIAGKHIKQ